MVNKGLEYKTELKTKGIIAFVPTGNSMWPTLKSRKQSVVVNKKTERLKAFDVALYERKGVLVLHRVIEVTDGGYITCGDSQLNTESVTEEDVFGVMDGFYRGKKYISASNAKYISKVKKWYGRKTWRKFRLKIFYFTLRVRNFIARIVKKILGKGKKDV